MEQAEKCSTFYLRLFPDEVLAVAEQDIIKHESARSAPGPGSGTFQHSQETPI